MVIGSERRREMRTWPIRSVGFVAPCAHRSHSSAAPPRAASGTGEASQSPDTRLQSAAVCSESVAASHSVAKSRWMPVRAHRGHMMAR